MAARKKPRWWWLTARFGGLLDIADGLCLLVTARTWNLSLKFAAWEAQRSVQAYRKKTLKGEPDG